MRITPESLRQSDDVIGMPCAVAAAHTGRPVALIGPRPGTNPDPLLWLLVWQPGQSEPERISAEWSPSSSVALQVIALANDPRTIVRVAQRCA